MGSSNSRVDVGLALKADWDRPSQGAPVFAIPTSEHTASMIEAICLRAVLAPFFPCPFLSAESSLGEGS